MPTFFAIDTMAVLYRSYFAMISKPLVNSKGINVSGMFGLTTSLLGILERERPDYLAVASDTPEPTFRHRRYPAYKATREKMPDDLVGQLPYIPRLVEALGLPYLLLPGWEADDIIGTLVRQAETAGMDSYMVTGDKDYMQLIGEKIRMYSARGDAVTITSSEGVTEKLGCVPERVVDLLALTGDSSDNVPGVPGVGPKTAARLVGEYGALENIYAHLDDLKGKLRENLENHREAAFLSRELVTIDTAVPLPVKVEELALHPRPLEGNQALIELFTELEFQRLRDRLISQGARARLAAEAAAGAGEGAGEGADQPGRSAAPPVQGELALFDVPAAQASPEGYYTLKSLAAIEHQLEKWKQASLLVLDTETTGLDYLQDRIIGLSFSVEAGEAYYIPLNHPRLEEHRERVLELLRPLLESPTPPKAGHNIKFDLHMLSSEGIRLRGVAHDTMIASHLSEPAERRHDLDRVALRTLGLTKIPTEELIGSGKNQITMDQVDISRVARYACEDADVTFRLAEVFLPRLRESSQLDAYEKVEMPLVPVLARMERAGIRFDEGGAARVSAELEQRLEEIREDIYRLAGTSDFNINSVPDLQEVLYGRLRLHEKLGVRPRKIKTGLGFSTDEETLERLSEEPLPRALLEYRELTKLKNTYLDQLGGFVSPVTGRIHSSFRQTSASTGRLASDNPNLQNIPVRSEQGRKVRALFVPSDDGHLLLSADYSQIELRVVADYSGDPTFLEAYRTGQDIHALTAAAIFDTSPEAVTREMRSIAKEVNFGLIYRMGADRLAKVTGCSRDEARGFIERFFEKYATIRDLQEELLERARKQGFALTRMGRRRYLQEINSNNGQLARMAEGAAVNTPIQGTAAEIIKLAMIAIDRRLEQSGLRARMVLSVHDELVFDVPRDEVEQVRELVVSEMTGEEISRAVGLKVPLEVEVGMGENWLAAH